MKKTIKIRVRAILCLLAGIGKNAQGLDFQQKIKLLKRRIFEELKLKVLCRRTSWAAKRENGSHAFIFLSSVSTTNLYIFKMRPLWN
jgi:hypothetical protein